MVEENSQCQVYIKDEQQVGRQHKMAPLAASNGPFMSLTYDTGVISEVIREVHCRGRPQH